MFASFYHKDIQHGFYSKPFLGLFVMASDITDLMSLRPWLHYIALCISVYCCMIASPFVQYEYLSDYLIRSGLEIQDGVQAKTTCSFT